MLTLVHNDDKKEKYQSHTVEFRFEHSDGTLDCNNFKQFEGAHINGLDILSAISYGETRKDALENMRQVVEYVVSEYKAIEKMFFESPFPYHNNIVEVDGLGNRIDNDSSE